MPCSYLTAHVRFPPLAPHQPMASAVPLGSCPVNNNVDWKLIAGSALFGLGWGLCGVCPGPSMVSLGAVTPMMSAFVPSMLTGMLAYEVRWWRCMNTSVCNVSLSRCRIRFWDDSSAPSFRLTSLLALQATTGGFSLKGLQLG